MSTLYEKRTHHDNPFLFSRGYLVGEDAHLPDQTLTDSLKDITAETIGQVINAKALRHTCIAFGVLYIPEATIVEYDEDYPKSEHIMHAQSGHTEPTAIRPYARARGVHDNFDRYIGYSATWHRFFSLTAGSATKRALPANDEDDMATMGREQQVERQKEGVFA
jgi:hypothetical protein